MSGSQTSTPTSNLASFLGEDPNVNRLYDNIQAEVPAITLSAVKLAAWNTIEEFYLRSTSRRELVHWTMAVGVQEIDFNPFDETWLVAWVLHVQGLYRFKVVPPGLVYDLDYPAQQRWGTVLLALKPNSFAATMPSELWQQWFTYIVSGVLSKLYGQPAKPYSNPQLAQFHLRNFRTGVATARAVAQAEWTDGSGRWVFPREQGFAMGRRKN